MKQTDLQAVQDIITRHLNETEGISEDFEFYSNRKLRDFAIESLELFEMIITIEDMVGKEIDDSIIDGELTIKEITSKILGQDSCGN